MKSFIFASIMPTDVLLHVATKDHFFERFNEIGCCFLVFNGH